jgi:hypothetical protein
MTMIIRLRFALAPLTCATSMASWLWDVHQCGLLGALSFASHDFSIGVPHVDVGGNSQ